MTIKEIAKQFGIKGECKKIEAINEGHINNTYKVTFKENGTNKNYIIQKINKYVFKKPYQIMDNIARVTSFMYDCYNNNNNKDCNDRCFLHYLITKNGSFYYLDDNEYYRAYYYIDNSHTYNTPSDLNILYEAGLAFGSFQRVMKDFDSKSLYITIPKFHDTIDRYNKFKKAIEQDKYERLEEVKDIVNEYLSLENEVCTLQRMLNNNELPLRVCHNDTKINNVLFDNDTNKHLAVIDLDTIMPGLILNDFGDTIRSACNNAKEDEIDLEKVYLDLDKFTSFTKGFLTETKEMLTGNELMMLSLGPITMTTECGVRFLTDYLNGDKYFRTTYPGHNIDRAKCQLKLAQDMISKKTQMDEIIKKVINELGDFNIL